MPRLLVLALRACVAAAFLLGLFGQLVVVPATAADEVERFPPYAPFAAPYMAVAIAGVACVQVALLAVWRLLGMVDRDAVFTPRAFRWVDTVIGAAAVATLLAAGVAGHLAVAEIPAPDGDRMQVVGALAGALTATGVGTAFVLLVAVLRGLLRRATDLETELAGVV
ncbi:DUF2975 domain-containing protein [Streptomyces sp. NPDC057197]|uniref:DUF2975 domain-containing protein n=1 Tax=unclassified Streptomyces TaxID=2593676 RepID=UPI0033ACFF32